MKSKSNKIKSLGSALLFAASLITTLFTVLLATSAFFSTSSANNMDEQKMLYLSDNVILSAVIFAAATFVLFFLSKWTSRSEASLKRLYVITIAWYLIAGGALIFFGRSMPSADPYIVYKMGESAANGDFSFFTVKDSYMSYYPQQIGITTFFAILIKAMKIIPFSFGRFHFIKIFYCILNCVSFMLQYKIIERVSRNDRVLSIFMLLSMLNLPFIMYSSFVYSEIPSFTAMLAGAWFMYKMMENRKMVILNMILSAAFFAVSVFLRKNSLIMVIAVVIVTLLKFFFTGKKYLLLYAALVVAGALTILPMTVKVYEKITGDTIADGVTMYSYVAMGMQEAQRGPGWYNGFNFNTYEQTGMDTEKTNEIANEAIKERLSYFKENPGYAAEFYGKKFLSQWTDPTLASCQATWADGGNRAAFVYEIYNGKYNKYYVFICNIFQNLVCIGAAIYGVKKTLSLAKKKEKKDSSYEYLFMITVFGGFLFHMFWEANSRYILLYAMMLVPYAAAGFGEIFHAKGREE